MLKFMSDAAVLGSIAAHEAAREARLGERFPAARVGVFAATGLAAASVDDVLPMVEASIDGTGSISWPLLGRRGLPATNPLLSFRILANMPPCIISILECAKGPSYIFTPWEGQAGAALLEAWRAVASGEVDAALAGAADTPAHPSTHVFLRQTGVLEDGDCPASAAAYLVLERAETAERDGQPVRAGVAEMMLHRSEGRVMDPLAERLGRMFAAAPAVLLALCAGGAAGNSGAGAIRGVDEQEFRFRLEAP